MNSHARNWSSAWLALRSLLWTILLPGVFAGYVPWRFFGLGRTQLLGLVCIGMGVALLAACIFEFARSGRGALPGRCTAALGRSRPLPVRAKSNVSQRDNDHFGRSVHGAFRGACRLLGGMVRVRESLRHRIQEPTLRRTFGDEYEAYFQRVSRWLPTK